MKTTKELLRQAVAQILEIYSVGSVDLSGDFPFLLGENNNLYKKILTDYPDIKGIFHNTSEFVYLYHFLTEHTFDEYIDSRICHHCHDGLIAFKNFTKGYGMYCNTKCSRNSPLSKQRYENTLISRYGDAHYNNSEKNRLTCQERYNCDNVFQREEIKEKAKETKLLRYGDENYANHEKRKKTCIERYGVLEPTQNKMIYEKSRETLFKHYGVKTPMESSKLRNRWAEKMLEKYNSTNMQYAGRIKNNEQYTKTSKSENKWLEFLQLPYDVMHRQFSVGKYLVDGYVYEDGKTKVIYEFLGDYWHGNPAHSKIQDGIEDVLNIRYQKTLEKFKYLFQEKYVVCYIWEHDWKYDRYLFGRIFDGEHLEWDDETTPMNYPLYMYPFGHYPHHFVQNPFDLTNKQIVDGLGLNFENIPESVLNTNFFETSQKYGVLDL